MMFGGGPMTIEAHVILAVFLYGPTLICTGLYAIISRVARRNGQRKIEPADHLNAIHILLFTVAAPFLVIMTIDSPVNHAVAVVLIPGLLSSAILGMQWKSVRHAQMMGIVTLVIAVASVLIDPRVYGRPMPDGGIGLFLLEPITWLFSYALVSSFASTQCTPASEPDLMMHCPDCGYSIDGLPSDICPECGNVIPDPPATAQASNEPVGHPVRSALQGYRATPTAPPPR